MPQASGLWEYEKLYVKKVMIKSYESALFQCETCQYQAEIFVELPFELGTYERNAECCICKKIKPLVLCGSLILRPDYPDEHPFQLQCADLRSEDFICEECEKTHKTQWTKLVVLCLKCGTDTMFYK